jgi:hypothetical protein
VPFYFDESIHPRGGFILGAYVFGPDPAPRVTAALRSVGLDPDTDEFKSSARMTERPALQALRGELQQILYPDYRYGVVVTADSDRVALGKEALVGLNKICRANGISSETAYFDRGIFTSTTRAEQITQSLGISDICEVRPEQDSRVVKGLQLADLVAHTCATMLLDALGLVRKYVKAGPNSGYDPDLGLELGFELWATVRHQFFNGGLPSNVQSNEDLVVEVGAYGLHIAESCRPELRDAAVSRFAKQYLGCIH